jgi:DNA-binding NarL/FixJ family response regulator
VPEDVRVVIVEDHPLYRRAVASLVEGMPGWTVAGAYGDAESALPHVADADVVVLDLGLPGMDGIAATDAVLEAAPETRVLVLTMSEEPAALSAAVRAGAHGYVVKGAEPEDIERALRSVLRDQVVLDATVASAVLGGSAAGRAPAVLDRAFPMLTRREVEVLDLVAAGRSNSEIAAALVVSQKTARNHVSSILTKLGLTRAEAIAQARDAGLGRL